MGSKKLQIALPVLFALVMIVGMLIGYKLKEETGGSGFFNANKKYTVQEVLNLVKSKYVDSVSFDTLNNVAIDAILEQLDPHSVYIAPQDVAIVNEDLAANFEGIGVEYEVLNDTITVSRVITGGPSEKAGIQVGDQIIASADTINLTGKKFKFNELRKYLRGPAGSQVTVTVLRDNQIKKITITRGRIPIQTVDAAYMIDSSVAYLHIAKFADRTYEEFMQNLEKLQAKGMKKLILDLRGNGGGLLQQAVNIADEFLDEDKLIVYTEGLHNDKTEYRCKRDGLFEKNKLVVLIDELSASASEVVSGALQDWDRATIIGRRSFGKGLVQQQFQLSNGGAIRLTVAKYFTPLGRNIQKPYNKKKNDYTMEIVNRFHNNEMDKPDTAQPKGPVYKTPAGHTVYGGGGITPDIVVPVDTIAYPSVFYNPNFKNIAANFVMNWYRKNKTYLATLSINDFKNNFNFTANDLELFEKTALKNTLNIQNINKTALSNILKSIVGELAWGTKGYYEIKNNEDNVVKKALSILK
ncbi:MAG: S41 family peptidase [Bacteroidetes bacterium]|nr:S41 family peptidase [Bacteroidota bacterium]